MAKLCDFLGHGKCGEQRCACHCECARKGLRTGPSAGRSRTMPAMTPAPAAPVAPAAPAANAIPPPAPVAPARSRSPVRHNALKITPTELAARMRSQNRFCDSKHQWPLEASWRFDPKVRTWGQAVGLAKTQSWLSSLDRGKVRCVKLQFFLKWARQQQQQQEQQQQQPQEQQQQQPNTSTMASSSTSSSTSEGRFPTCCVCHDAPSGISLEPCGHICLCAQCAEDLVLRDFKTCPLCRATFGGYLHVYMC